MNACRYLSILWSKTKFNFMSIKLFCSCFVQFTILWFHSSLKQAVQPELSLFHVSQSSQLSFWLDQYCLSFVTSLILLIYMNAYRCLFILWSKTKLFVSIKLFRKWFVQFTIIWFHSSLKQAVQPELSLFHVLQSNQHFFYFHRNWVKSVTNQDQIVITIFF